MDDLVCPKLAGFLKLTQKLKAKIQRKKDDNGKDLCPICGSKSNKGNLCQPCFMRSFRPIAYTRNIKVVEQNEFFYGTGEDRRWKCRKRTGAARGSQETKEEIKKNTAQIITSSMEMLGTTTESSGSTEKSVESSSDIEKTTIGESPHNDPSQPIVPVLNHQFNKVELVPSNELFKIDLVDTNDKTEEEGLEPLPKFVPDFWESPSLEDGQSMGSKIKTFTDHVIKEAQRPFKEIFCDSKTIIIAPGTGGREENVIASEKCKEVLHKAQEKLNKPLRAECCQSTDPENHCITAALNDKDILSFRKQLKQNAILELLKVAFRTNVILNNLYQYFRKVVESDGSNSENSENDRPQLDDGNCAADSKISVDSFMFPNRRSAVLWGAKSDKKEESEPGIDEPNVSLSLDNVSDTEVISKSQATLSMLLNPTGWSPFRDDDPLKNDHRDDFIGPCPGHRSLLTSVPESTPGRLVTRKYHSEHSRLRLEHHQDESKDGVNEAQEPLDLGFQPSSIMSANAVERNTSWRSTDFAQDSSSPPGSNHSGKSLLDLVFGLNRSCVKPSLVPLPDCQQDLITLSSPEPSSDDLASKTRKDADSQTALSPRHLEEEMSLLHEAFLNQLAHFSVQLVESCRTFGHSWQTSSLAELVEHFRSACSIITSIVGDSSSQLVPSSERLDELQDVSNKISVCLAKLRAHPHSFVGDCSDHDISTLLSSPPDQSDLINTWV